MKPEFINVDLDLVSMLDPAPLTDTLGRILLSSRKFRGRYFASFELCTGPHSLDLTIARLCDIFEKLPSAAAHIWEQSLSRTFDIGLDSGDQYPALSLKITPRTLQRVTALGATLAITLYPVRNESPA